MSFSDLYDSGQHVRNLAHFSALVNLASINSEINPKTEAVLKRLANKLNIGAEEYKKGIANPNDFPVYAPSSHKRRLERLYDVICIIFADHSMDPEEEHLLQKYAIALGFSSEDSAEIINKSIKILSGKLSFDDYFYLLNKK